MKKHKKRVSLKDIAERTGLSVPTISQILNRKSANFSSEATKKMVLDTAAELGYRPNFGYKVMLGEKTKTVALVISIQRVKEEEHIKNLIIRLMDKLDEEGYATYVSTLGMNSAENIDKINELIARGTEHFIFIGSPVAYLEIENILEREGKTFIGYNSILKRNVDTDTCFGMESILRYFLNYDKKNIKLLMTPCKMRLKALGNIFQGISDDDLYKRYVVLSKTPSAPLWNFTGACFTSGYEATAELLKKEKNLDGIIYLSDLFALGGARYLREKGYKVGEDIWIAGYNYTSAVKYSPLPVISVEHDLAAITSCITGNLSGGEQFYTAIKPILHTINRKGENI